MLRTNSNMIVGRNFLLCLCVICLAFASFGFSVENSFAADLNETMGDVEISSADGVKLENSQNNDVLEVDSQEDVLSATLNGGTFKDIKDAIAKAKSGDVIKLSNTFKASGEEDRITIDKKLTITSSSQATLDGRKISKIFYLTEDAKGSVISNLKFINGVNRRGGAIITYADYVTVDNCIFENNYATYAGGAISTKYNVTNGANTVVKNCYFKNNGAYLAGGALGLFGDKCRVEHCVFDSNYASNNEGKDVYGGAIQLSMDKVKSTATVSDSVFINNWAKSNSKGHSHGGAGCIRDGVSYIRCNFTGNSADEGGALTYHASGTIRDCIFTDNKATAFGGAVSTGFEQIKMDLDIVRCVFNHNSAPLGGAVQLIGENINVKNSVFNDNTASKNGGAINIEAKTVVLTENDFNRNVAEVDGGAIYVHGNDVLIQDSLFNYNHAIPDANKKDDGLGGAVYVNSNRAKIIDNEFKFNTARNGSAIYYDDAGTSLEITGNVMYQNQAWVYFLPIHSKDIYFGDEENISVVIYGGNNIARYDNLNASNAIYNGASYNNITVDGLHPIDGATNTGELYQDDREYHIDILLEVVHEDGTVIYNDTLKSSYLGEINITLQDLKPGKYYVTARHFEDTYYKAITNVTSFNVYPKVDNQIIISSDKDVYNYDEVAVWTVNITNAGPNNATEVYINNLLPEGLFYLTDTSDKLYDPKTGILNVSTLDVGEKLSFIIRTVVIKTGQITNDVNIVARELDTNLTNNNDKKTITVNPAADIEVIKSVNNTYPDYKDVINWTIVVKNNGPDVAHNITVHDIIPKTLIPVFFSKDYDNKTGSWKIDELEVNGKVVFNIVTVVGVTGLMENNASAHAVEYDYRPSNNEDIEKIEVRSASDLSIVKSVNATDVNYLDIVKWTLVISNNGPDNATEVKITDALPEGFTLISSTRKYDDGKIYIGNLSVGEVISIDLICKVETTGNYTNFASVEGDEHDYNLTNNHDNESITVYPASDIEVTKEVDVSEPEFADEIVWTIKVRNNGPDVAHDVKVYELLPEGLIWMEDDSEGNYSHQTGLWSIGELDIGEEISLEITCKVNKTGILENRVNATAREYDYNLTNNEDNESVEVDPAADITIIKMVNNTTPNYNDLIKWTIIISNNGPDKATAIEVDEKIPDGLILVDYNATKGIYDGYDRGIWFACCLENGETQTLEIICRVNKTGNITNNVKIEAEQYDPNETNNQDNESIEVPPAVDIEVVHNVDNITPMFGQTVKWMITIKNNGPDNATLVELTDILPDSLIFVDYESSKGEYGDNVWNVGNLSVGESQMLNITSIANSPGIIINDASATSFEYDWNKSNNNDDATIDVRPVSDLSVEKFVSKSNPNYGEIVTWTLRVSNNGPNDASDVKVSDVLPKALKFIKSSDDKNYRKGIWSVGSLKVGEVKELKIRCKVISTGLIKNIASVSSYNHDPNPDNDEAEKVISVRPASDLSITKIASKSKYSVGDMIEYVIEVVNNGPDTARNVKVEDIMDDLLKLKSFKVTSGKFNKHSLVWTIDSLGNGESARLYIKAVAVGSGMVKNSVSVVSDSFDYDMSNNKDSAVVKVVKKPLKEYSNHHNGLGHELPSNLEMHKSGNPLWGLVISMVFSMILLGGNTLRKR